MWNAPICILDFIVKLTLFDLDGSARFNAIFNIFISLSMIYYFGLVIWSTMKRLENNEITLVTEGKAAAALERQQASSTGARSDLREIQRQPDEIEELK